MTDKPATCPTCHQPLPVEEAESVPAFWLRMELPKDAPPPVDLTTKPFMRGSGPRWTPGKDHDAA